MKPYSRLLLSGVLILAQTACNSDIYMDRSEIADYTEIFIPGDGGEWHTIFSRKGLERIRIDYSPEVQQYVRLYSRDGSATDTACPVSDFGSIVFENPVEFYSIGFEEEILYITSNYNARNAADNVTICLDYDSGETKTICFTLTPGEALQTVFCSYEGDISLEEDFVQTTHTTSLTNNGPIDQHMEIIPYADSRCRDTVIPDNEWATGLESDMSLLAYNGDYWELRDYRDIILGRPHDSFSPAQYFNEKIVIDVPAQTKATVCWTIHYTQASQKGTLVLYNPVADIQSETGFTHSAIYPTGFDYTVTYE